MDLKIYHLFIDQCQHGKIKEANMILKKKHDIPTWVFDESFNLACFYGHFEIIKWLLNIYKESNEYIIKKGFYSACQNGHFDITDYLLTVMSYPNISNRYMEEVIIRHACEHNQFEIIKYIWNITLDKEYLRNNLPILLGIKQHYNYQFVLD